MKEKVMIFSEYYLPGVKGGGPIQSISNLVNMLAEEIDFYIVTSNKDLGDIEPYENVKTEKWIEVGPAKVMYLSPEKITSNKIYELLTEINCKSIYLNSFFSYQYSILPIIIIKRKKLNNIKIVLAPRGEFSKGAISLKSIKKKLFIKVSKLFFLHKRIIWHATSIEEKNDIKELFKVEDKIIVANNLTKNYKKMTYKKNIEKITNNLKVVFISRIHPKKNLKQAITFLHKIKGIVEFNIYGPIEDERYWIECKTEIQNLPKNIEVSYQGVAKREDIDNIFKRHHIFLFPTLGENYGHVISEALINGCPVIISDQTPWKKLQDYKVGWDIKLKDEDKFIEVIQYCMNLNQEDYLELSQNAFEFGMKKSNPPIDVTNNYNLFR